MGKDSKAAKPKEDGGKGMGKQGITAAGGDDHASKGKGKAGKSANGLVTCTYVKARHILCEKQGKINEAYKKLQDGWLSIGAKVLPAELRRWHQSILDAHQEEKVETFGRFPEGKWLGRFRMSHLARWLVQPAHHLNQTHGYHLILCEGRKN